MKSACVTDRLQAVSEAQTTSETSAHFTWTDANGNVCDLIDTTGSTVAHYEYTPFGSVAASTGEFASANPWQFSSKYYDAETHLKYYGYRYLENGRWLNRDPIEEWGGLMLYGFVGNNAVNLMDILGLTSDDACCPNGKPLDCAKQQSVIDTFLNIGLKNLKDAFRTCGDRELNGWIDPASVGLTGAGAMLSAAEIATRAAADMMNSANSLDVMRRAAGISTAGGLDDASALVDDLLTGSRNFSRASGVARNAGRIVGGASIAYDLIQAEGARRQGDYGGVSRSLGTAGLTGVGLIGAISWTGPVALVAGLGVIGMDYGIEHYLRNQQRDFDADACSRSKRLVDISRRRLAEERRLYDKCCGASL